MRQQGWASRRQQSPKVTDLVLVSTCCVVGGAATIRPPKVRRTAITRGWLCWDTHADMPEREGTFRRKYRINKQTFKKLVALPRPTPELASTGSRILPVIFEPPQLREIVPISSRAITYVLENRLDLGTLPEILPVLISGDHKLIFRLEACLTPLEFL